MVESVSSLRFSVLPIAEYRRLLELDEDAKDAAALHRAAKRLGSGEEATCPRMLSTGYWPVSHRLAFGAKCAASRPPR